MIKIVANTNYGMMMTSNMYSGCSSEYIMYVGNNQVPLSKQDLINMQAQIQRALSGSTYNGSLYGIGNSNNYY